MIYVIFFKYSPEYLKILIINIPTSKRFIHQEPKVNLKLIQVEKWRCRAAIQFQSSTVYRTSENDSKTFIERLLENCPDRY